MAKKTVPIPENQPEERIDEKIMEAGKYEITPDAEFKVTLHLHEHEGRWLVMNNKTSESEEHWAIFRMWSYQEEITLRKDCTMFDDIKRVHFVDHDILNRMKIQKLLKSWSFDEENERLSLHHVNGVMVDEDFSKVMNLHPTILRFLIERMNSVLEYNG